MLCANSKTVMMSAYGIPASFLESHLKEVFCAEAMCRSQFENPYFTVMHVLNNSVQCMLHELWAQSQCSAILGTFFTWYFFYYQTVNILSVATAVSFSVTKMLQCGRPHFWNTVRY